jgi:multiple sugar transport system ATP-binding protein
MSKGGISLRGITKAFGKAVALDGVDLEIAPGEAVAITGPSGSGKSTLLRIIAGLEEPDEGEIDIGGVAMNDVPARQRDVAMVFQSFALYPHLTVFRNLATPLELRGVPRAETEQRVEQAAELLDIAYLLNRKPGLLSGGQRQRVALARAIVRDPAVFLFDEPLSNLDAQHRAELRREIVALHRRSGASLVLVTHDRPDAEAIADRIVVMRNGRITAHEDALELPAHLSVRHHLDAMREAPR